MFHICRLRFYFVGQRYRPPSQAMEIASDGGLIALDKFTLMMNMYDTKIPFINMINWSFGTFTIFNITVHDKWTD